MAKLQLRVKHKGGQSIVSSLNTDSRVQELQEELSRLTQIPVNQIKVLRGFPPSAIDLSNPSEKRLSECGIQERDTILVEELKAAEMIPQTKGAPPTDQLLSAQSSMDATGILLRKVVPSDNSCLFTSIGFCLSGKCDKNSSSLMRELVAGTVKSQPEMYSEALLGKPNKDYCKWIQLDDSWGGAIEIAILSSYYGLEIDVVDTQNAIINKFGEDQNYGQRILLIYDGIHYDPLYLEPFSGGGMQTLFPATDISVLRQAEELAAEARASHQYTDVYRFSLICQQCRCMLQGQTQAQLHAKETGHTSFGEVNPGA